MPFDCGSAAGGCAGLTFAAIGAKAVLKIAKLAIGLAVVAQGGAAGLDRLGQDIADDGH